MKINKLLFFLLAVFSLNSCVEYVDNGTKPTGPEQPEEQKFTAEQANPDEAKYIGDVFEFKAMLNGVDVTATTKFRINGTNITGKTYTPAKLGDHSVIATMDNLTATFKFKVLEKEEEPEPTGNRIEYGGKSYPVDATVFVVHTKSGAIVDFTDQNTGNKFNLWAMASTSTAVDSDGEPLHQYITYMYVPKKPNGDVAFPNEGSGALMLYAGVVIIDGNDAFDMDNVSYTFAGTGNTVLPNWMTQQPPWAGTANYTSDATGENSGESAKLFWNGSYNAGVNQLIAKAKSGNIINGFNASEIKNFKSLKNTQFTKLKK